MAEKLGLARLLHLRTAGFRFRGTPARLLQAIQELGPTFIKFGQLLSTRPDILPRDYITELSKLQDTASVVTFSRIRAIVEEELKCPIEEVYSSFSEFPIAAASLGQVHTATLLDGTPVIVKVQRPNITGVIESDIEIMYAIAKVLESRSDRAKTYALIDVVDEFAITIHEELDYTREAQNTQRLKENLAENNHVYVPKVYWDLVTKRVLTMERIEGVKITDINALKATGADLKEIASNLVSIFFKQVFLDGFFHADPHPGNLLVTPEHKIALIDAGQVRQLDRSVKSGLVRLMLAYDRQDTKKFADEVLTIGITRGDIEIGALTQDLEKVLRHFYNLPSRATNVGQVFIRVMHASARHRIRLPMGFAVLGKVIANIDGINRLLNPDFNFTEATRPYLERVIKEQLSISDVGRDLYRSMMDVKDLVLNLPEQINLILRKAIDGTLRFEFKHKGLDELESRMDKITNRLAFALIVGSSIIGSSIIVAFSRGSKAMLGIPFLGLIGYVVATIFGMWLLISIIRSGRL
jgi:ubiquinone biosynthesis protein